ncbi:Aste57867_9953 [Aphanomyces stellatus]|uniref:Aste57867_9953 protein n=1 Tax=Aphanomyces stellatus TaxID=120398 RepID=A0A485KPH3_9STRA|nr:hypothetical protein As57867_009914 [Aphanomyces stellatus]VFT86831.1 Aste57867_9953 [Aphanomyces stellatus]
MPPKRLVFPPPAERSRRTTKVPAKAMELVPAKKTPKPAKPPQKSASQQQLPQERKKKGGKPTTLADRILFIVHGATSLVGLPTLKKRLVGEFGMTDSPAFRKNVAKTLVALYGRSDFGRIGGSFHGGETSEVFLAATAAQKAAEEEKKMKAAGLIQCCWCEKWCDVDCFICEDSIARGGKHKCGQCGRIFWTWISDGYTNGHRVEYRKGPDF